MSCSFTFHNGDMKLLTLHVFICNTLHCFHVIDLFVQTTLVCEVVCGTWVYH